MREITSHKVNGLNEALTVTALGAPGSGNAHRKYLITWPVDDAHGDRCFIDFQEGPISEVGGVNGISNEALLAIVEDRLKCFQSGPYSCRENSLALTKIQEALHWLKHRTLERVARGVEGTSTV